MRSRHDRILDLAERMALMASLILGASLQEVALDTWGLDEELGGPLAVAATKGALAPHLGDRVNYVNASRLARDRGIEVVRSLRWQSEEYPHLISVTVTGPAPDDPEVHVLAHEGRLELVWVNLIGNGLKYTPDGGSVHVSVIARDPKQHSPRP